MKICLALIITFITHSVFAVTSSTTLGDVAGTLNFGAGIMAYLMWAACIVVGIILFAASFSQYQIHRNNPKLVPLAVPITYFILAFIALSIPFLEHLTGVQKEANISLEKKHTPIEVHDPNEID